MEIGELAAEQYAQLILGGNITLGSAFELSLSGGFVPQAGDQFALFSLQPNRVISGSFSQILRPESDLGYWDTTNFLVTGENGPGSSWTVPEKISSKKFIPGFIQHSR